MDAWQPVLDALQRSLPEQAFHTWFEPLVPLEMREDVLLLRVPNRFYFEWIEGHYAPLLDEVAGELLGGAGRLQYALAGSNGHAPDLDEAPDQPAPDPIPARPAAPAARPRGDHGLSDRFTFANFIVGPQNEFAHAASVSVAKNPGTTSYNPLLVYGGVGLGKTHLLQAIGNGLLEKQPDARVRYISSERFTQEFVEAIKANKGEEFSARYRRFDLLLMDDVQFLVGRERTLMEFFHIFNALYQAGKQIVLSSDRPPRELQGLDDRLVSRFAAGLVADIKSPDYDTRIAILQAQSEQEKVPLPQDVIEFLASRFTKNVRELQGAVIRLIAHASLTRGELTLEMAREALRDLITVKEQRVTVGTVQRVVAEHYSVAPDLLLAKVRTQPIAKARMVAMALALKLCRLSLKQVGAQFGGRDHTTVLHARKRIDEWERSDPDFNQELAELVRRIESAED